MQRLCWAPCDTSLSIRIAKIALGICPGVYPSFEASDRSYLVQKTALDKLKNPTPRQAQELAIVLERLRENTAQTRSARTQLVTEREPNALERAEIAIPLFLGINIALMILAVVFSHSHYDPEADAAIKRVGDTRRAQREREREFARRQDKRAKRREQQNRDLAHETRRRDEQAAQALQSQVEMEEERAAVAGAVAALDESLRDLHATYQKACIEVEKRYTGIIARYWETRNRLSKRRAAKFVRAWDKSSLKAVRTGSAAGTKPLQATWQRPPAQDLPLRFTRPDDLVGGYAPSTVDLRPGRNGSAEATPAPVTPPAGV